MNFSEIAEKAEELRKEQLAVVDPTMSNYRRVLDTYKQILNDMLVLVRELAQNLHPSDDPTMQDPPRAGSFYD